MKFLPPLCSLWISLLFLATTFPSFGQSYDESLYGALEYRLLGPFRGGRSAAVTGVPNKPNLFYFGATGGGVWRTQNGGRTWENISDGYFGGSIGAIEVAEDDPNVLYVGGGEQTVRGNVSSGYGMWKSVDAGKTWTKAGLEKSRHIPRIATHPKNHNIVYAAVLGDLYKPTQDRGVYKSLDGGTTWKRVLFANENAGATDLTLDPNNPRILYASTWNVRRTPYSLSSGGEGSALWKSTDSGETWKEISKNKGFPTDTLGIIGVTVSPLNSERVWAIVENKEKGGVYRSDDGGATWEQVNSDRSLRQRAWYYTRIYADTKDENTVYVLNVSYHKSTDGGKTFKSSYAPHGDHHDLWIAPEDAMRMIMGDDGGAQISYDGGETWSTYHNQPTAQFYRVTTDNAFPYRIYGAQQDNSTVRIPYRTEGWSIGEDDWEDTAGGESAHIAVDPENPDIVYGGSYDGFLTRVNHKTGTVRSISVWPDNPMGHGAEDFKYRFQWNFPIFFSPHDPKVLYTASNHLHKTTNEGESWELISPDLTRNDASKLKSSGGPITQDNTSVEYYCTIFAAAESPKTPGLLWTGSDDGLVFVSRNGGKDWTNATPKGMPEWMMINSVEPSRYNEGTCYIAGTRYKSGDYAPYLYKTTDYGKTWKKITTGIPAEHFTRVVREDGKQQGLLYAGTEAGMYISFNDGESWQPFQLNLPIVPITDLACKDNNLIVATQGRSMWVVDDLTVLHQLAAAKGKGNFLYKPRDTYRMDGGYNKGSLTAGTNHPDGVMVYYNLEDPEDKDIRLSFLSLQNDTIKTFSTKAKKDKLEVKKGSNLFVWDTRGDGAEKLDGMILWWASLEAPKAVPGIYKVVLEVGDEILSQNFEIVPDRNAETDIPGMQRQFDFITEINVTVDKAHQSIKKIRNINAQLEAFQKQYQDQESVKELVDKAKGLSEQFSNIEKALYQTQNRSGQDPLNFPIKLTNKLAHLNSLVSMDDFPPTRQDVLVKDELTQQINAQLVQFDQLVSEEVQDFNAQFNALKLDYLFVEEEK
ncbi:MAG TPA: glycosyl hydrolase [Flavobacteriaceae bacterium]|nr:glycosyl hydrolase [Flavobacteriaceae bacterium]MCB9212086.1 glycosyl hydrolase [Alteromonas sp.]HPF09818.1 glycosyl hydrolase [Flavobacteriaceae bacterium]HQU22022.1 glycosyl hydrolase [Flavobacteriaceae bacterium]HQU64097.1 glycosyl hydrolase [Flavobacteriaceae bacterium]